MKNGPGPKEGVNRSILDFFEGRGEALKKILEHY